ncbi:polysaccharide deacetylase family protein [Muricauda sp. SCSIO 65647]|nr:polysaccharide deacetylase family protein [Muricauda sp. SCSIO 65647]
MLLIYTHKITPRFRFTMGHIFEQILGIEIGFTTTVEDFIKHKGAKMTYTKQPLQNEFFVRSNDLLFEKGINDFSIQMGDWEGLPSFFEAGEKSVIPYDIFSASFFLLSRYEEYLPHVKDELGRYPAKESLAYQNGFLELPVVDLWALKLFRILEQRFPEIKRKAKAYRYTSIINVTTSHSFALRGMARSLGALMFDLGNFRLRRVVQRLLVHLGVRKDPFDNFSTLIELHKKFQGKTMFFFQFADYSTHDKNISPNNNKFRHLIKAIADYSVVALSTSFHAGNKIELLRKEKKRMAQLINRPIKYSRLRYNKVNIPTTYRNLMEAEFTDDFSMGYTHEVGFRAGTCTPFYFYDINLEEQQPLKVHPFAVHDYALTKHANTGEILEQIDAIYRHVKQVKGQFVTVFSNELLGSKQKISWLELYQNFLKRYYV